MSAPFTLSGAAWSSDRTGEMLRALVAAAGFMVDPDPAAVDTGTQPLPDVARAWGMRVEPALIVARSLWSTVRRLAPVVLELPGGAGCLAIASAGSATAVLSTPSGRRRVAASTIEDALWAPLEASTGAMQALTAVAAGSPRTKTAAARILATPELQGRPLAEAWAVRPMTTRVRDELRAAKIGRRAAAVAAAYLAQFALLLAIWNDVGSRALAPDAARAQAVDFVPLFALLAAWVVAQLGASWLLSRLALDVGARVRAALMRGALRLDRDRIRTAGIGQLLGRAMDAEVLDVLALGGGVETVAGVFELVLGVVVLALGAAPLASLSALALVLLALGAAARAQARRLFAWSHRRRALTHDLVERMVGHRTVLVQDLPEPRAQIDAAALDAYAADTRALDRWESVLSVAVPRLWFLAGLGVLAPVLTRTAFQATGVDAPAASVALSIGGVWLVYGALRRLAAALPTLALARDAWTEIAPLVGGAEDDAAGVAATADSAAADPAATAPLVSADGIGYQYPGRPAPVLTGVNVTVADGERVLVQGASGGGKSTLAALLTGLRTPTTGHLRLRGVDQRRIGLPEWRRAIAGAPQFHDNHVFCADVLFNVLMGRRWPPRLQDVEEAERVCHDVGLGPLLQRMPAGLQQQVGETGWRLSHGERSRLFVARSLLQQVDVRVLDESFAALDPETLDAVLAAVLARPQALIVIAHP